MGVRGLALAAGLALWLPGQVAGAQELAQASSPPPGPTNQLEPDGREPSSPGKFTVQGQGKGEALGPLVPPAVSIPVTLAAAAGGFVLLIPQLSIEHVLNFKPDANRTRGYLGMGVLSLTCGLGLGLSGAKLTTVLTVPLIEAGLIGLAFGSAWLTDKALRAGGDNTLQKLLVGDVLGYPLLTIAVPLIAAAALFPVLCAFLPGYELEREDERAPTPMTAVGLAPVRGGAVGTVAFRW
jgi:hypothetical protein